MYRDYDNPWDQTEREQNVTDKYIALKWIQDLGVERVIEIGCGLGHFSNQIVNIGVETLGIDVSSTSIQKARVMFPQCKFQVGDILDVDIYKEFKPDLIIMAEVT